MNHCRICHAPVKISQHGKVLKHYNRYTRKPCEGWKRPPMERKIEPTP